MDERTDKPIPACRRVLISFSSMCVFSKTKCLNKIWKVITIRKGWVFANDSVNDARRVGQFCVELGISVSNSALLRQTRHFCIEPPIFVSNHVLEILALDMN